MKKDRDSNKKGTFSYIMGSVGRYIKSNYSVLIMIFVTFVVCSGLSFVKIATTSTISSYNLEDYEIGQISDITIKATKSLAPDAYNPVSVEKDEKVIRKGFPITEEGYAKLKKMAEAPAYIDYRAFANSVIFHLLNCILFFFFRSRLYFKRKIEFKEIVTECLFYLVIYAMAIFASKTVLFSSAFAMPVIIPSTLCVVLVAILFGQLNAVFFSIVVSLGVLNAASYQLVPFLFTLTISLATSRIVNKIERRIDMIFASLLQALLNVVFLLVFKVIFNDSMNEAVLSLTGVAFNGFISGILCLGLLTPLEMILNTASPFRLMELSDLNNPVMKKMLVTCSGTYNHSMMVASLAEAACREIGANSLLARVGAYYHDIGKMDNPEYFVENQNGGENIHKAINPSLSVSIIRSHVKRGMEKAHSMRLPQQIVDIIGEHHGNQVIAYFYNEAKQSDPNASSDDYAYTGNPPSTKESAVVMLADTVEAACRTLEKPSVPRLDKFISTLINGKIELHQLDNCDLTFNDLTKIHDSFVQILAGYYHSRIEYPDQKDPDSGSVSAEKDRTLDKSAEKTSVQESKTREKTASKSDEPKKTRGKNNAK